MPPAPRLATLSLLLATVALAAAAASAAETVHWPAPWKAGETWAYDTESLTREIEDGKPRITRTTDRTEIRVDEAGKQGYTLTWTGRDSRIEAIEGDRSSADTIAPILDQFDGYGVVVELDAKGRYRRVRNLDETTTKVRTIMQPLAGLGEGVVDNTDPKLAKPGQAAILEIARLDFKAMLESFFNHERVEAMTTGDIKTMTRFSEERFVVGKTYRDTAPLASPMRGRPLPANREYVLDLDRDDPSLARLRWTHTLDTRGDAAALRELASELAGAGAANLPADLALREEGMLLFRLETGVVELMQTNTDSHYADKHDEHRRSRMRLVNASRTWAQEDAAQAP